MDIPKSQLLALDDLVEATKGRATLSLAQGHWRRIPGSPFDGAVAVAASAAASAKSAAGWSIAVRFDPPDPTRSAAQVVREIRGVTDPLRTAKEVADGIGSVR
uniref:Uncharacterized protein n=1 Tax=Cyclophora tenuis TaxID=216820 RepID=A0A7S1DAW5_CYCTE